MDGQRRINDPEEDGFFHRLAVEIAENYPSQHSKLLEDSGPNPAIEISVRPDLGGHVILIYGTNNDITIAYDDKFSRGPAESFPVSETPQELRDNVMCWLERYFNENIVVARYEAGWLSKFVWRLRSSGRKSEHPRVRYGDDHNYLIWFCDGNPPKVPGKPVAVFSFRGTLDVTPLAPMKSI